MAPVATYVYRVESAAVGNKNNIVTDLERTFHVLSPVIWPTVDQAAPEAGPGDALRVFHDDYGDAFVNALLRFNVPNGVTLDAMWVDVDGDGDNLTSFGEPHAYAYESNTPVILQPGQYLDVTWEALVEGRWQFDLALLLYGFGGYGQPAHPSGVTASIDGTEVGKVRKLLSGPASVSFHGMLCTGPHRLRMASNGDQRVDITQVTYRKLPTDPDSPDTDGDGLPDGREACGKRTDPTSADTDSDGLTDYAEVYAFYYNNATSSAANVTVNVTVDAAGEYQWTVKTSATVSGGKPTQVVVYLDGQLKFSKKSASAWTENVTTFDAILPKGLHSLQVQKATATGTVTLKLVNVTKPSSLFTNALFPDTDKDWLSDGDELLGRTGWITSPSKADSDGDWASDGLEVKTLRSDPLLKDTDHDGFVDGKDLDPLFDLVVQLTITKFSVSDSATNLLYQARPTVGPNWTNSQSIPKDQLRYVYHNLSVNVRDDASVLIKIQVFSNENPQREMDVSTQAGQKAYTQTLDLRWADQYNVNTYGTDPGNANLWFDLKVVRVGKANTLLMVPNDWSALTNGTDGGRPTGLHRYVGEQRFVFGLLNVTDGHGDLVSYDLETKLGIIGGYYYQDLSATQLHACHSGDSEAPGYFGRGARLSGSGSFLLACGSNPSNALNTIDTAFTVAFWIKPDTDYVSGSGWNWSFGRKDLWRLGFSGPAQGVRLEVWDTVGGLHTAQAVHPVYAGRWVHLAATMAQAGGWTRLVVYANGNPVAWKNDSSLYSVRDGTTGLYLGWDEASGASARFKGTVDEFRLFRTALSQESIRGLLWFLNGANNVLIPGGVFYESKLYGKLNETSMDTGAPFAGGTAYGNSNTLSSDLNSRVIQLVIAKNLTLAQAWQILELARTKNGTLNVTAFPFFATSEFYTLGFPGEVNSLTADTSVLNGGNYTPAPPPLPPSLWQLFWNTIAGWAERAWNAVLAVGAFFESVGRWLIDAAVGTAVGLIATAWSSFQDNVLDPFVEALEEFIRWLIQVIDMGVRLILSPALDWVKSLLAGWTASLASLIAQVRTGGLTQADPGTRGFSNRPWGEGSSDGWGRFLASALWDHTYLSPLALAVLALVIAASAAEKLAFASSLGMISLLSFATQLIAGIIIGFLVVEVITTVFPGTVLDNLIPGWFDPAVDLGFTAANFLLWYWVKSRPGAGLAVGLEFDTVEGVLRGTLMALVLIFTTVTLEAMMHDERHVIPLAMLVVLDAIAVGFAAKASVIIKHHIYRPVYPLLYPAAIAIWLVSLSSSLTALFRHIYMTYQEIWGP